MESAWAVTGLIAILLTLAAYSSLRFTTLDPQMPIPRARWLDGGTSIVATVLLLSSASAGPRGAQQFLAYLALGLIFAPAIIPPYRVSVDEDPQWFRRKWRSFAGTKAGVLIKATLLGVGGLLAGLAIRLIVDPGLPEWLIPLGFAAGFSILTRPFSIRQSSGRLVQMDRLPVSLAAGMRAKRVIAFFATLFWLSLAYPLLEQSYSGDFKPVFFLTAILLAFLAS